MRCDQRFVLPLLLVSVFTTTTGLAEAAACYDCPPINRTGPFPAYTPHEFAGSQHWFTPNRNGEGWTFGTIPAPAGGQATGFAISYTYKPDGSQGWLLLTGSWQYPSLAEIIEGAPIATLEGQVYDGVGGACPTCAWTDPSIGQREYGEGRFVFPRPDRALGTLDGESTGHTLIPIEIAVSRPLPDALVGRWAVRVHSNAYGRPTPSVTYQERTFEEHGCETSITASTKPHGTKPFVKAPSAVVRWVPSNDPDIRWFKIHDSISCLPPSSALTPRALSIAFDPSSNAPIRALSATSISSTGTDAVVETHMRYADVFLIDANTILMYHYDDNVPGSTKVGHEYLLTRLGD